MKNEDWAVIGFMCGVASVLFGFALASWAYGLRLVFE